MTRLNVKAIKAEICRLAADKNRNLVRYTKLCALRASMKGKLHFSPSSNLAELHSIFGIGKIKLVEFHYRTTGPLTSPQFSLGGVVTPTRVINNTKRKLAGTQSSDLVYRYAGISKKMQAAWVADLAREFALPDQTPVERAADAFIAHAVSAVAAEEGKARAADALRKAVNA